MDKYFRCVNEIADDRYLDVFTNAQMLLHTHGCHYRGVDVITDARMMLQMHGCHYRCMDAVADV